MTSILGGSYINAGNYHALFTKYITSKQLIQKKKNEKKIATKLN